MTTPATTPTRGPRKPKLHHVTITPDGNAPETVRLVIASSAATAAQHVLRTSVVARVATPEEAHELGKAGVEIETAGELPGSPSED